MDDQEECSLAKSSEDEISSPLVFSCANCRLIVGDSYSYLLSNEELKTITLTGASDVSRSADIYTSKSGADVGATYFKFSCMGCESSLGRFYLTTSQDMDAMREKFTFLVSTIKSYELGKILIFLVY